MATFAGRVDPATGKYVADDPAAVRAAYQRDGWVTLRSFLTEAEIKPIEVIYNKFMVRLRVASGRGPSPRPRRRNSEPLAHTAPRH